MINFKDYLKQNSKYNFVIDEKYIIKVSNRSRYTKDIANKALNNIIVPFPNFEEFTLSNKNGWNKKNQKYGNSYQLYIHTFRFINELLLMYEETEQKKYYQKATEYIYDWLDFVTNYKTTNLVWYDHSVAQRVQVILFYLYLNDDGFEEERFGNILEYHAEFMMEKDNYKYNNHSLMMDRSLMLIGLLLKNDRYFDVGYYRSIDTFWRSFSKQGFHLENSPDYHNMVIKMYLEMESILKKFDKSYGDLLNNLLIKASKISGQIALHTNTFPVIGDTNNDVKVPKTSTENFVDYEAGYAVLQNDDVYLGFISGYSTTTHKHHDDLSIIFMYKNKMILEDGGKFNYSSDDTREYMLSINAHSNIHINNENYELDSNNIINRKVKIVNNFSNNIYSLIKGRNSAYENVDIYRTVILINVENTILILDEVYSKDEVNITYNFNLSHEVNIESYKQSAILKNDDVSLKFSEVHENKVLSVFDSNNSSQDIVNSVDLNKKKETNQLRLDEKSKDSKKLFIISNSKNVITANLEENIINVSINNNTYRINF